MAAKEVKFGADARNRLQRGVNRIERATQYASADGYRRYGYNRW